MSEYKKENEHPRGKMLRKAADFSGEIQRRIEKELREELELPVVDQILKDLQSKYGIRVGLSPNLIERFEAIKEKAKDPALRFGCETSDVCIFCDSNDYCRTCDAMDWCVNSDTHLE